MTIEDPVTTSNGAGEAELVARLQRSLDELRGELARAGGPLEGMVGKSAAMQEVFASALSIAGSSLPVIVEGESGTGKSLLARAIHALSSGERGAFGVFDAEATGETELENKLVAAFEKAQGGTLLLEEIAALAPAGQEMLGELLRRHGGARPVSTTRWDLPAAVREGRFRGGLAEELGSRAIRLPPLRSRREDISLLSDHFLRLLEQAEPGGAARIDPRAAEAMSVHGWPGNVRELRTVISRSRALTDGPVIGLAAIQSVLGGASARRESAGVDLGRERDIVMVRVGDSMADVERRLLHRTLEFARGNKKKAAEILKLSLKTIYNKVKEYGLEREFNRRFR